MDGEDAPKPVVIITGCSTGGIGHALACAFAEKKCKVVATSRSRSSMAELEHDHRFLLEELDVQSDESVSRVVDAVVQTYGRIDVLVNNAGIQCVGPLAEVPLSSIQNTFDTNVFGKYCNDTLLIYLFLLICKIPSIWDFSVIGYLIP